MGSFSSTECFHWDAERGEVAQTPARSLLRGTRGQGGDALQLVGIPRLAPLLSASSSVFRCCAGCWRICHHSAVQGGSSPPGCSRVRRCFGTDGLHSPQANLRYLLKKDVLMAVQLTPPFLHCIVSPADQLPSWQTNSRHGEHNCTSKAAGLYV